MLRKTGNIFVLLLYLLVQKVGGASDIQLTATISPETAYLFDRIYYELTITGSARTLPDPRVSFPAGLRQMGTPQTSSQITFTNGVWSSRKTFTYVLRAQKAGLWTIPPAIVRMGNRNIKSNSVSVNIVKFKPQQQSGSTQSENQLSIPQNRMDDVFLWATVSNVNPYIGEAIIVSYRLFTRLRITGMQLETSPSFSGFWSEEVPLPQTPATQTRIVNGIKYTSAVVHKVILYPTVSGELTIDPLTMSFNVQVRNHDPFDSFFNDPFASSFFNRVQTITRSSQSLTIDVKPLPTKGKPADFSGAVGTFEISAQLNKSNVQAGDAIVLTVQISGKYGLKTIPAPKFPTLASFKVYDPKSKDPEVNPDKPGWMIRSFEYVLVPHKSGEFTIPPIRFSYFDPLSKTYKHISTQSFSIHVSPPPNKDNTVIIEKGAEGQIKLLNEDIRYIKTNVHIHDIQMPYKTLWFYLILLLPFPCVPIILLIGNHYRKMQGDQAYARAFKARSFSQKLFEKAKHKLDSGDLNGALDHTAAAFTKYLGNRLNLPPGGLTLQETITRLNQTDIPEDLVKQIRTYWEFLDQIRYSPIAPSSEDVENTIKKGRQLIDELEKKKLRRYRRRSKNAILYVLIFLLFPSFVHGSESFQALFDKANKYFEAGEFETALTLYLSIEKQGCHNDKLYYNIGTCFLKNGDIGRAILYFRRAERFAPRDSDIQANLHLARMLVQKPVTSDNSGSLLASAWKLPDKMTIKENSILFSVFYLLTILLFLMAHFSSYRRTRKRFFRSAIASLIILILLSITLGERVYRLEFQVQAVAINGPLPAKSGPGNHFSDVFTLQKGYEMIVKRKQSEWVEIQLPNGYTGWVPESSLEEI